MGIFSATRRPSRRVARRRRRPCRRGRSGHRCGRCPDRRPDAALRPLSVLRVRPTHRSRGRAYSFAKPLTYLEAPAGVKPYPAGMKRGFLDARMRVVACTRNRAPAGYRCGHLREHGRRPAPHPVAVRSRARSPPSRGGGFRGAGRRQARRVHLPRDDAREGRPWLASGVPRSDRPAHGRVRRLGRHRGPGFSRSNGMASSRSPARPPQAASPSRAASSATTSTTPTTATTSSCATFASGGAPGSFRIGGAHGRRHLDRCSFAGAGTGTSNHAVASITINARSSPSPAAKLKWGGVLISFSKDVVPLDAITIHPRSGTA